MITTNSRVPSEAGRWENLAVLTDLTLQLHTNAQELMSSPKCPFITEPAFELFLENRGLLMIVHDFVTPETDFGNVLYMELPLKSTWKCQSVQNLAAGPPDGQGLPEAHKTRPIFKL